MVESGLDSSVDSREGLAFHSALWRNSFASDFLLISSMTVSTIKLLIIALIFEHLLNAN